jgi:hypothetical protein
VSGNWWELTWLVVKREIAERTRARSFYERAILRTGSRLKVRQVLRTAG